MSRINIKSRITLARKYDREVNLKGVRTSDILKLDPEYYNELTTKELKKVVSRVTHTANQRLDEMKNKWKEGTLAPSFREENFKVRGKKRNNLLNTLKTAKTFLESKTSTKSGWEEVRQRQEEITGLKMGTDKEKTFWKVFHRLEENNAGLLHATKSKSPIAISNMITDIVKYSNLSEDDIYKRALELLGSSYEEEELKKAQEQDDEFEGVEIYPDDEY